jgi:hypothetical protein
MGNCVSDEVGATTVQHLRAPQRQDAPQLDGDAALHTEVSTPFPIDDDHDVAAGDVSPPRSWKISERRRSSNNSMMQSRRRSSQTASPGARISSEKRTSLLSSSRKSVTTFHSTVDGVWSSSYCATSSSIGSIDAKDVEDEHITVDSRIVAVTAPNHTEQRDEEQKKHHHFRNGDNALAASVRRRSLTTNVLVPLSQIGSDPSSSTSDEEGVAIVERLEDLTF